MVLTPQMRQSLNLLGMPMKDLSEYIETALANNPFLKKLVEENRPDRNKHIAAGASAEIAASAIDRLENRDNPRESLLSQIRMSGAKDKVLEIAEYLIYELDDNGYLKMDAETAAADLFAEPEEAQEALELIQAMDPAGIGASDVRECLQLQLKRAGKENSLEYSIVTDYIDELARSDAITIAKELGADQAKVKTAIEAIKKLNPRPASTILAKDTDDIIPEIRARVDKKKVRLELNRSSLPTLKIYNPYENELDIIKDPEARKFLKENMEHAKGLIDGLKRREDTICKVTDHILNHQKELFGNDKAEMKCLTINDIARALDLHPSTISRTLTNKHIEVNGKVIALKSLLSHGVKKENGETTPKTVIKERIRAIVAAEDRTSPFSDSDIEAKLRGSGITIKRRTVAKYREAIRILPAHLRKKRGVFKDAP